MNYILKKGTKVLLTKKDGKQNYSKNIMKEYILKKDIEIDSSDFKKPELYFSKSNINPQNTSLVDLNRIEEKKRKDILEKNKTLKYTNEKGYNDIFTANLYYAFENEGFLLLAFKNKFKLNKETIITNDNNGMNY